MGEDDYVCLSFSLHGLTVVNKVGKLLLLYF